jgi:dinuclear metal center YbgI/SA1388 family protein
MRMALLQDIAMYCDQRLAIDQFKDYCPNGLQVEAGTDVQKIISGVTASLALIEAAIAQHADLLLVHHGYFWKNEAAPLIGMKGRRIQQLMKANISLLAYHLPLDAHPELGNNARLGRLLGLRGKPIAHESLIWGADLDQFVSAQALADLLHAKLGRTPIVIDASSNIQRVAWCTGAAQSAITQAATAGYDAFISGEISEQTLHQAHELGISYFAAGHHATEKYGIQALGDEVAGHFAIEHQFIDFPNPA